jgi:hypothetical protein
MAYDSNDRVRVRNNDINSKYFYFTKIICQVHQATMSLKVLDLNRNGERELIRLKSQFAYDLMLGTIFRSYDKAPMLMTYEETGYCALVPSPLKIATYDLIFIKPLDSFTWVSFVLTLTASVAVWKWFQSRGADDSHWFLLYGIFVMFIGQGINFSRYNRRILAILLQLLVLMTFILSEGYQGIITSFMIESFTEPRLKSFKELFRSNFEIVMGDHFSTLMQENEDFKFAKSENRVRVFRGGVYFSYEQNFMRAIINECDELDRVMRVKSKDIELYIINDMMFPSYVELDTGYMNFFLKTFQTLMDYSFEAGLSHAWDLFEGTVVAKEKAKSRETHETEILTFNDLLIVFYILPIGFLIAFSIFLGEIFFADFINRFPIEMYRIKYRKWMKRVAWQEREERRLKIRRKKKAKVRVRKKFLGVATFLRIFRKKIQKIGGFEFPKIEIKKFLKFRP